MDSVGVQRGGVVGRTAERMRELVFRTAPDDRIGSLPEIADELDVGIVTVQQAARILEHEGLLRVRRGPGGGYFGRRPDDRTLKRALEAYLRMHPDSIDEALDITSLLFIELCGAAARAVTPERKPQLQELSARFAACRDAQTFGEIEQALQDLLFEMVARPIFELLTRATLHIAKRSGVSRRNDAPEWIEGRKRILAAIADGDEALARFEADRGNRQVVVAALEEKRRSEWPDARPASPVVAGRPATADGEGPFPAPREAA